jgi:hypothetical protein
VECKGRKGGKGKECGVKEEKKDRGSEKVRGVAGREEE